MPKRKQFGWSVILTGIAFHAAVASAQSAPAAFMTANRYDSERQLVGTIAPDPDGAGPLKYAAVRNTYDAAGKLIKAERGELAVWQAETVAPASWAGFTVLRTTEIAYDAMGRKQLEVVKDAGGMAVSANQYSYDAVNRLECTAVRMNPAVYTSLPASACTQGTEGSQGADRITKNLYDAAGQLVQVRKAVGTSLEQAYATYSYTANGKQDYVIDANGNRAKLEYDGFDRQVKWIFPSSTPPSGYNPSSQANALATAGSLNTSDYEQYGYDANGNRTSLRKRDGSVLTYQYDALNRNTVKTVPERSGLGATHTRDVYYSYDLRGLMTSARFDSTSGEGVSTVYDGFGRVASSTLAMNGVSRQLASLYDADGNRTRLTFPDGGYVTYAYDGLDRPKSVTGNAADWSRSYLYDASGALASDTAGSGGVTSFGRDGIGRLTSIARDIAGGASLDSTTTFAYNPASQAIQEGRSNDAYAFTARANVSRTYTPNGLNQYTAVSSNSYCYDPNGNLTADGVNVYLYDAENRLVEKRAQGSGNTNCSALSYAGSLVASLRYDPMGRLYETVGANTGITRFLIDGDALVAEYDTSGTLLRRYVHGADGKADDPIAWYEGSAMSNGALRQLYANHQGSVALTSDLAGAGSKIFRYDEYGVPQTDSGSLTPANGARFLYTGQAWLPELGMYYYKARIYAPMLGRFMQTDPIGYDDQINLYAYVANDPLNKTDPTGQVIDTIADIGFLLYDGYVILTEGATATNVAAAAADAVATVIPGATGGGVAVRAAARTAEAARTERAAARSERTFQTYTKTNERTGQVYTGRTSGTGRPEQNVARRDQGHHKNEQGYGPARLDKSSSDPQAIRGREQQMIERNGGAQSQGGTSGNSINGLSDRNPANSTCRARANNEFGPC